MRINARLDEDRKRKLEYLMRVTGLRVSDIIKQAIDALYERSERTGSRPGQLSFDMIQTTSEQRDTSVSGRSRRSVQ